MIDCHSALDSASRVHWVVFMQPVWLMVGNQDT